MARDKYLTSPPNLSGMPPGVPYIIGNEAAERFSYYGMKSVLTVFMAHYLLNQSGVLAPMSDNQAYMYSHVFVLGVYALPVLGAILADGFFGKYRTILSLSIVYCLGNLTLACMATTWGIAIGQRTMLAIGLFLICLGAGGIKPCVSANVGDQFGESNKHLLSKMFGWFYFSINAGSFIAASGAWLFARNIQPRRPHHARPDRNGLRVHSSLLGTLGDEQRCGMDFASRENESALARHGFDRGPGANSKSDLDPDFYSVAKLRHLPGDQPRLSPYSTA